MNVYFDNRQDKIIVTKEIESMIIEVIKQSIKEENIVDNCEVSVSFVDNIEIRNLNKEYRGIDKETDVLSFPLIEDISLQTGYILLGDIVVSLEKAKEQAMEYGHSFEREVAFLVSHSMFHLFGYDHIDEENTKLMREKEETVLEKLGILRQ